MSRVALIAGEGRLPGLVADALGRAGTPWRAHHLDGHPPIGVGQSHGFRVERLGSLLAGLRDEGVTRVCLAGRIARPALDPTAVDERTAPLIGRVVAAMAGGDATALGVVVTLIEEAGFTVAAPHELAPALLDVPEIGTPGPRDLRDVARARQVLAALGAADVGQGCVVSGGQVLAVEALPGTDWMLASLAPPRPGAARSEGGGLLGGVADWLSGPGAPQGLPPFARPEGGVLVKAPKVAQDRRVDLPAIGPDTVRRAAAAGLGGIAVERGGVLVLDRDDVEAAARAEGLFVQSFDP